LKSFTENQPEVFPASERPVTKSLVLCVFLEICRFSENFARLTQLDLSGKTGKLETVKLAQSQGKPLPANRPAAHLRPSPDTVPTTHPP
jgi:hypothetical protein